MVAVADTSVLIDHVNGRRVHALEVALAEELLIVPLDATLITGDKVFILVGRYIPLRLA